MARSWLGTAYKKDLPNSPFIKEIEYGTSNEGYWCYEHMVLYFEDVVDYLTVPFPQYDYLFLFDHSCRHDKQREDGLNATKNAGYSYNKRARVLGSIWGKTKSRIYTKDVLLCRRSWTFLAWYRGAGAKET